MARRSYSRRRTASPARRTVTRSRSRVRSRGVRRKSTVRGRSGSRAQTVRIVIEQPGVSTVSRPDLLAGLSRLRAADGSTVRAVNSPNGRPKL